MASEQAQNEWDDATNTFTSKDCAMKGWGDEEPPHPEETAEDDTVEELARKYLEEKDRERGVEDPFDYTPWIATLPMPQVKEIEQNLRINGLKLRKQIQADLKRNPLLWDALRRPATCGDAHKHPTT